MLNQTISQSEILKKLGIESLNEMQEAAAKAINRDGDAVILSPTGTGKTLAFLLPIIEQLDSTVSGIQVLVLVPSRELAMQIEQVMRSMGSGHKVNAVYGGRSGSKDRMDLSHAPAVLIGTPGRVADHIRTEVVLTENIKTLVLDEFDKSLEVGFEGDMKEIIVSMKNLKKRVLTSATKRIEVPGFVRLSNFETVDFLGESSNLLELKRVDAEGMEKEECLVKLLNQLSGKPGIVFCNFKDSIGEISKYLIREAIPHGQFFGGMEQRDREKALIKFRNGTHQIIVATDLAARGLDIPELDFIVHYELPQNQTSFVHRNGRTARMNKTGAAYIVLGEKERLPGYIDKIQKEELETVEPNHRSYWSTLYVSGGRRDKISKGDIAGLFMKQGQLEKDELGLIEVKQECAYVAVRKSLRDIVIDKTTNTRLKKKKVRVSRA